MNQIKFSHQYEKMIPGCYRTGSTKLLEVFVSAKKELSDEFIKYDTEIKTWQDATSDNIEPRKYYELPSGKLLVLLLTTTNSMGEYNLWTTIRRWTLEKEIHYKSIRGQEIEILIVKDDSTKNDKYEVIDIGDLLI